MQKFFRSSLVVVVPVILLVVLICSAYVGSRQHQPEKLQKVEIIPDDNGNNFAEESDMPPVPGGYIPVMAPAKSYIVKETRGGYWLKNNEQYIGPGRLPDFQDSEGKIPVKGYYLYYSGQEEPARIVVCR